MTRTCPKPQGLVAGRENKHQHRRPNKTKVPFQYKVPTQRPRKESSVAKISAFSHGVKPWSDSNPVSFMFCFSSFCLRYLNYFSFFFSSCLISSLLVLIPLFPAPGPVALFSFFQSCLPLALPPSLASAPPSISIGNWLVEAPDLPIKTSQIWRPQI